MPTISVTSYHSSEERHHAYVEWMRHGDEFLRACDVLGEAQLYRQSAIMMQLALQHYLKAVLAHEVGKVSFSHQEDRQIFKSKLVNEGKFSSIYVDTMKVILEWTNDKILAFTQEQEGIEMLPFFAGFIRDFGQSVKEYKEGTHGDPAHMSK